MRSNMHGFFLFPFFSFLLLPAWGTPTTNWIGSLSLDVDTNIYVNADETLIIRKIGGSKILTKTGPGTLLLETIETDLTAIHVDEGTFGTKLGDPNSQVQEVLNQAAFHLDATDFSTMTFAPENGTNFVTQWRDAEGRSRYASVSTINPSGAPDGYAIPAPHLVQAGCNGLPVLDFGYYYSTAVPTDPSDPDFSSGTLGYNAAMMWNVPCNEIREVFAVVADEREVTPEDRDGIPILGSSSGYPFIRDFHHQVLRGWPKSQVVDVQDVCIDDSHANRTVKMPNGFHLINFQINPDSPASVDLLGQDRNVRIGGMKYAEIVIFTNQTENVQWGSLTPGYAGQRGKISKYLMGKWGLRHFGSNGNSYYPFIEGLRLKPDTSLWLQAGTGITIGTLNLSGQASLKGTGVFRVDHVFKPSGTLFMENRNSYETTGSGKNAFPRLVFSDTASILNLNTDYAQKISAGNTFTKQGKGILKIAELESPSLRVEEGSLQISPIFSTDASFHVDACAMDSMIIAPENGTNFVSSWKHVTRGGVWATNFVKHTVSGVVPQKPYLRENFQNGLPVMDFGQYYCNAFDGFGKIGYNAAMLWSSWRNNIHEILLVVGDVHDGVTQSPSGKNPDGMPFLGNTENYFLLRGGQSGNLRSFALARDDMPWYGYSRASVCELDQVPSNAYTPVPEGMHLVHFATTLEKGISLNTFCLDRSARMGGLRYGEVIIFEDQLEQPFRKRLSDSLMAKWFNAPPADFAYGQAHVAKDSSLCFPYGRITLNEFSGEGTLRAKESVISNLTISAGTVVDGDLTLPEDAVITGSPVTPLHVNGVVTLAGAGILRIGIPGGSELLPDTPIRIIESTGFSGDVSRWRVEGDVSERYAAKLVSDSNGLSLQLSNLATVILLR